MLSIRSFSVIGGFGLATQLGCGAPVSRAEFETPQVNPRVAPKNAPMEPSETVIPKDGRVTLRSAQTVNGILFTAGSRLFLKDGIVSKFTLGDRQNVQGVDLPQETEGEFYKEALIGVRLHRDWAIQGPTYSGDVYFYGDHSVHGGRLSQGSHLIDGIPCAGEQEVTFNKYHELKEGVLAEDFTLNGIPLPQETDFHLHPGGKLYYVRLPRDWDIQGHPFQKGIVIFFDNGQTQDGRLSKDDVIEGIPCAGGGHHAYFHENGKLRYCALSRDSVIKGVHVSKESPWYLDENGHLEIVVFGPDLKPLPESWPRGGMDEPPTFDD